MSRDELLCKRKEGSKESRKKLNEREGTNQKCLGSGRKKIKSKEREDEDVDEYSRNQIMK